VSLRLKMRPDGKLCGKIAAMTVIVQNGLGEPIEIGELVASRHRIVDKLNELNGETVSANESLAATAFESSLTGKLIGAVEIAATLPIPPEDGVYSDAFTLRWRRIGSPTWLYSDAFLKLEVVDGCAEVIDDLEYESLTNRYSILSYARDGKDELKLTVEGAGVFDGTELPEAASSESADFGSDVPGVEPDSALYQYFDDAYDQWSDDEWDEDLASDTAAKNGDGPVLLSTLTGLNYCVKVRYHNDAYQEPEDVPAPTTGMRWWRPYKRDGTPENPVFHETNFLGLVVELWDRDTDSRDDYITSATLNYSNNTNYFCITFDWDQTAQGELYPDPFILTRYIVEKPQLYPWLLHKHGYLCADSCSNCDGTVDFPCASWRSQYFPDLGEHYGTSLNSLYFTPDSTPTVAQVQLTSSSQAIQMANLQKFFQIWDSYEMTGSMYVKWGNAEDEVPHTTYASTACIYFYRRYWYVPEVGDPAYIYWHQRPDMPAHEAGHAYHSQLFPGTMHGTCNGVTGHHFGYCAYNDHCATDEGWAHFVSARSWYPDEIDDSEPWSLTQTTQYGLEPGGFNLPHSPFDPDYCYEDACTILPLPDPATWNDCYSRNEFMVARAFWDMFDSNPDGLDETSDSVLWPYLADIWTLFPPGTGNHQADEDDPYDGPYFNMMDYFYHASEISNDVSDDIEAAMENNVIDWQDPL